MREAKDALKKLKKNSINFVSILYKVFIFCHMLYINNHTILHRTILVRRKPLYSLKILLICNKAATSFKFQ